MTTEKVNDLELVKLSDYFTPGKFRTIPGTAMTDRGGITEMQAVFNINTDFAKRLTFQFSTMLVIYGFGILNDKLIEINKSIRKSSERGSSKRPLQSFRERSAAVSARVPNPVVAA